MYVVTGSTGHLGANLIDALVAMGKPVRALVRGTAPAYLQREGVEIATADVLDISSLRRAFVDAEVVFHLAAMISIRGDYGGKVTATNVDGAHHVATCALEAGVRRLVHFSSCHAYDLEDGVTLDETGPRPSKHHTVYDQSKAAGEERVREVIAQGLDAVILNPTGVIGPLDYKPSRMGQTLLDLRDGRLPGSVAGGFDWVDARDVVAGALAAEEKGLRGENYILGGHWLSVKDLMQLAADACGGRAPWFASPIWLAKMAAPFATAYATMLKREPVFTGEAIRALAAPARPILDRAKTQLGYQPRPMEETLADTYAFFKGEGM